VPSCAALSVNDCKLNNILSARETIKSENNCKKETELHWSCDERRGFVEGRHGGQNGGDEAEWLKMNVGGII